MRTVTGLQQLLADVRARLHGRRVGLVVNHTSVDPSLRFTPLRLLRSGISVTRVFSPEHGLWGTHQDMEPVGGSRDPITGLPVISLYGSEETTLAPPEEVLADVDVLVFDIQDIGTRYYTFAYTLLHAMQVAGGLDVEVLVCDRPNPIRGVEVEGNLVAPDFESFVGRFPLPNRHGLTVGELAKLFVRRAPCALEVLPMTGWRRSMWYEDTGLPWVAPSPNMPQLVTALLYPGMCLLEGTNVSEGRGTTTPFEVFGAPWLDPLAVADVLRKARLPGLAFRPLQFRPMFQKHAGELCGGIQIHVLDRAAVAPVRTGLWVLSALRRTHPEHFAWRTEPYEFVSDRPAIDLLAGTDEWRRGIDEGVAPEELLDRGRGQLEAFLDIRASALLYPLAER